jgi:hypothetical protein
VLFRGRRYKGAAYLCGYAVEVALKVRIARTLRWLSYPDNAGKDGKYRSFMCHDLDILLELSGKETRRHLTNAGAESSHMRDAENRRNWPRAAHTG